MSEGNYQLIVFFSGTDAEPHLKMLEEKGPLAVIDLFGQWEEDSNPVRDSPYWGSSDTVLSEGCYHL